MHNTHSLKGFRFPLFWQILLTTAAILALTIGIIWSYLDSNFKSLLLQQSDTFAKTITQQAANSASEMLMASDKLALSAMLDTLVADKSSIQAMQIFDDKNKIIAQSSLTQVLPPSTNIHTYTTPIQFQDVQAGKLVLQLDNSAITDALFRSQKVLGIIIISISVLALIIAAWLATHLSTPLKKLREATKAVSRGNLNPKLPPTRNDEVGDLVNSVDNMLQGLRDKESIENKFSTYISKDIAKGILENLHTNRTPLRSVYGSVLFVDIVGFTQLCEKVKPEEVADILNQYYFLLHQAAKMYRGTVDNYIGDGAMLTFGVHKEDNKHTINAICSAQIFLRLADIMNTQRIEKGLSNLEFKLGIHCGEMLAGTIGSTERMQLTITGDTVNVAARMCEQAHRNKVIISENIFNHPATKELVLTENPILLDIKGKALPLKGHHVIGLAPKFNRLLMQQETELEAMNYE
ncbi:hypothetical protein NBRC116188_00280 [Oceaniserpentilla sp. 4NH20-0058]|uniref:adenylate/guanylate cyclase domain-containing protein n=1 Tax=Oceaniserpentilla sp. 4NH20-0058 TaxID=3127660 RepID=UPI00310313D0